MPHLQNPLGSVMPDAHKRRLAQLCNQHSIPLIEDDTFGALLNDNTKANAIKAWDRSGNVIYCASLNKILAPGMRLGWITAGRWQARVQMLQLTQTRSHDEWSQATAAEFMETPMFDRHLHRLRSMLRSQREHIADAVARYFPLGTRMSSQEDGMTLWIELPHELSSEALFNAGLQQGILIAPGTMFSNSNRFDHFFRINCGLPFSMDIDAALLHLGQSAARLLHA
jgi:DNA-binding transcriptional MocR family regulator